MVLSTSSTMKIESTCILVTISDFGQLQSSFKPLVVTSFELIWKC